MPSRKQGGTQADGRPVRLATTVKLGATSPEQFERALNGRKKAGEKPPSARRTLGADLVQTVGPKALGPPNVRLAHVPGAQGDNVLLGQRGVAALPDTSLPALLVSYVYLQPFLKNRHVYRYRDWVLDSGAFSAHNSGEEIRLPEYIDCCKELLATDPTLTEVFALDVIGDWRASKKNCEKMWKAGVPAIPCFHFGEPWKELVAMARDYPKIALGGVVGQKVEPRDKWIGQCFARVWPKKIHGFGFSGEKTLMRFPFHSVDATNWELGPCKYGTWKAFGHQRVSVRGSKQNLRAEVEWYLDLERRARERWKKEMALLESQPDSWTVRLCGVPKQGSGDGDLNRKALAGPAVLPRVQHNRRLPGEEVGPSVRHQANAKPGREDSKGHALGGGPAERLGLGPLGGGGGKHAVDSVLIPPTERLAASGNINTNGVGTALSQPPPTLRLSLHRSKTNRKSAGNPLDGEASTEE